MTEQRRTAFLQQYITGLNTLLYEISDVLS